MLFPKSTRSTCLLKQIYIPVYKFIQLFTCIYLYECMQLFLVYCIILVYCVILVVNITDIAIIKLYDVDRKRHESPEKGSGIGKSRPAGTEEQTSWHRYSLQ